MTTVLFLRNTADSQKYMKLGISTASFFSKELTENTFKVIDELDIGLCEVFLTTFREYEKEFVEELNRRKGNIEVYSLHTLNVQFEPELYNTAQRTREDSEYFFKKVAVAADILQARYYTFHGLTVMKRTPYKVDYEKIGRRTDELDAMLKKESGGVCSLSYENVHWTRFNSPDYFSELKKFTEVKTCLDIKQAMQSGFDVYDYADAMGDRLVNVHVCDYDSSGRLFVPGKGSFDFITFFKYLLDKGYDGSVIMELYAGNYTRYDEIRAGYDYLTECLEKAKQRRI